MKENTTTAEQGGGGCAVGEDVRGHMGTSVFPRK